LHRISDSAKDPEQKVIQLERSLTTRGLLEVNLQLPNGTQATVFGVHLPSPANPVIERKAALATLRQLVDAKPTDELVILGGDFNIPKDEESSEKLFRTFFPAPFLTSHFVGCKKCLGTHNYRGEWSFLDVLIVREPTNKKWQLVNESITSVEWAPGQVDEDREPIRFDAEKRLGFSDHLPLYAELESATAFDKNNKAATAAPSESKKRNKPSSRSKK
jgi:hypothetical protein